MFCFCGTKDLESRDVDDSDDDVDVAAGGHFAIGFGHKKRTELNFGWFGANAKNVEQLWNIRSLF